MSSRRAAWLVPLLYFALAVIFFLPSIIRQQVPLPLENVYTFADPLWQPHRPAQLSSPANFTLVDLTNYYYPYMKVVLPRLLQGDLPLWNPLIYSGMPLMATHQPAVLYPLTVLFAPLGPNWIWIGTGIVRMFLMGYGLHLLMRRFGVSHTAAFWSGITYAFCGSSIAWLHFVIHNVLAFLPLALYSVDRLIEAPRGRWFLLLTGALAFQFLGGHPETSVLFALVWGSFTLVTLTRWPLRLQTLGLIGLAVVAAIGLVLPQLLPTLELIRDSQTYQRRAAALTSGIAVPTTPNWANLKLSLLVINPYVYLSPLGNRYLENGSNYNELITYMGVLSVPFIFVGAFAGRPRRLAVYWALLALVSFGLMYYFPGFVWLRRLPVLNVGAGIRFLLSWSIAAAVLTGFGVDWVLRARSQRVWVVAIGGLLVIGILAASIFDAVRAADGSVFFGPLGPIALRKIAAFYNRGNGQVLGLLGVAALGACLFLGLGVTRHRLKYRPLLLAGLLTTTFADLLFHGIPYNGFAAPQAIYPKVPVTAALRQHMPASRFMALDRMMYGNTSMTQGLHNVLGEEDVVSFRYTAFASLSSKIGLRDNTYEVLPLAQRFFDVANVEFLVTSQALTGATARGPWQLYTRDGNISVYRNPNVQPRAYLVPTVRTVPSDQAISAVYDMSFDPTRQAIVEETIVELGADTSQFADNTTRIIRYEPEQVVIETIAPRNALLVLSDSFAPGWRVTVDGQPARIYRTNAVYRGVVVPQGTHQVVMTYRPRVVEFGLVSMGGTMLLCVGGCLWNRRRQARQKRSVRLQAQA